MIRDRLAAAVAEAVSSLDLGIPIPPVEMERPKVKEHGDWSTNIALHLAKPAGANPRQLAQQIVERLGAIPEVEATEIAGPGFINFRLRGSWLTSVIRDIEEAGTSWGRIREPEVEKINVEFVSANPTGPLHLGHGRWAALGDALASVLEAAGHEVEREFYVNDYGRQMDLFGESIGVRYDALFGREGSIPEGGYQGAYVTDIAESIKQQDGDRWLDADPSERIKVFSQLGRDRMIEQQTAVLERLGVRFDTWFSETTLHESGAVSEGIERLAAGGHVFEQDGALWLRSTDFGDDKDRVIRRADGTTTYLAPDISYYLSKRSRGFDRVIFLWGADHHGYVARMKGMIQAVGDEPEETEFLIGQMVTLLRGGEPVRMSKRTGEFVTFEELIDEVGSDATRYTFIRQGLDSPMDFDLDLAVKQSQENPVFYVQYAHARIASILRLAQERGIALQPVADIDLEVLGEQADLDLLRKVAELPEIVEIASRLRSPHRIPRYAEDLAAQFHAFYRDARVLGDDPDLTQARLHLCRAAMITLANALALVGVSAPERMDRAASEDEPQ